MGIEVKVETALVRFVAKTRALYASEPDPVKLWEALTPVMAELLADPTVIEASKSWPNTNDGPRNADGRVDNLLFYEDPDYGFALQGLKKVPGRAGSNRSVHDHGRSGRSRGGSWRRTPRRIP